MHLIALGILAIFSQFSVGMAATKSSPYDTCVYTIIGVNLPEDSQMIRQIEAQHDLMSQWVRGVIRSGYVEEIAAQSNMGKIRVEMQRLLQLAKDIKSKHDALPQTDNKYQETRRKSESNVRQNALIIYANYEYMLQVIQSHIKTAEEIKEFDVEAQLDNEFNIKKINLN